jgi:putative ABC transport system ATP-binding protein
MENGSQPLIRLDQVSKVFVTDEVETHALAGIHFDVKKGEYLSIAGPSGQAGDRLEAERAGADSQPRNRLHLSGV